MKIAFLTHCPVSASNGGVERVTYILGTLLKSLGNEVFFCNLKKEADNNPLGSVDGIHQEQFVLSTDLSRFGFFVKEHKIDILINQIAGDEVLPFLNEATGNIKIISVFHSLPFGYQGKVRKMFSRWYPTSKTGKLFKITGMVFPTIVEHYYNRQYRHAFRKVVGASDRYVLLSQHYIDNFVKELKAPELSSKIIAINNPNTFDVVDIDYKTKRNEVLFVGRIYELSKNIHDLLDAWKQIEKIDATWKLRIVGDGPDLQRLKAYVSCSGIRNVIFEGHQTDVAKYYASAKIFVMTSIYEGWGMVLTEAMANGCAVCCYDSFGAVNDLIEDNISGFIVPKFNTRLLSDKIQLLMRDSNLCAEMGNRGSKHIRQFSSERIVNEWNNLMTNILK